MSAAAAAGAGGRPIGGALQGALVRPAVEQEITTPVESPMQLAVRRFSENRLAMGALAVFLIICSMSFATPWFESHWAGRTASEQNLAGTIDMGGKPREVVDLMGMPAVGPGLRREYTFGADSLGRDVFVRTLAGGSVSLRIGFGAALLSIVIGTAFGLVGGFYGGTVDKVLSYVVDVMIAFPAMLFMISLSAAIATSGRIGPISASSILVPLLIIGGLGSFGFSRIIRARALELAGGEFVEAARALGAENGRIMTRHILPHLVPTIITYFGIILSGAILAEAGLSFLGVGVQPPTPSWGGLIADGRSFYSTAWWISGAGGLMLMLTVLSVNLVGEAVEEAFDPKSGR